MLLNSFLILTWFGKITAIIENDREDDSDIAHHGFPSNALKRARSRWLNWSVQMACFFVLALLHSFSSHSFPPFSSRENDISALERAHLCRRSNPYGCIGSSRELYIHQRSRRGACLSLRVSKKKRSASSKYIERPNFLPQFSSVEDDEYKWCRDFPLWDGFSRRCEADEHPQPPPNTYLRTGEINEGEWS